MTAPSRPVARRSAALLALSLLLATALVALCAPGALAATGSSPSSSPVADAATVNWTWLAVGLGVPLAGLVVFYFIRRGGGRSNGG
jgi:hypothetical protein